MSTLSTGSTALALCTTSVASGYALFAGGACGKETLKWSGSSIAVTGAMHSNDQIKLSGGNNTVTGDNTTVNGINNSGSNNTFNPPATTTSSQPWPVNFSANDFLPVSEGGNGSVEATVGSAYYHFYDGTIDGGVLISEGWLIGTTLEDGVYVATGDIVLADSNLTGTVTRVTVPSVEQQGVITF